MTDSSYTLKRQSQNALQIYQKQTLVCQWIAIVLQKKKLLTVEEFPDLIRNGYYISQLYNKVTNSTTLKAEKTTKEYKMIEQLNNFLKETANYGIKSTFKPDDLIFKKNLGAVFGVLEDLAKSAEKKRFYSFNVQKKSFQEMNLKLWLLKNQKIQTRKKKIKENLY